MNPEGGVESEAMMRFNLDEKRACQATGILLGLANGRDNYTKVLKLLYLADRRSLSEVGHPITTARFVNMTNGPVLSEVYRRIQEGLEERVPNSFWAQHIRKAARYEIELFKDPGDGELSDYDVETLSAVYREHGHLTWSQLIDFVHTLPEWVDPGEGHCLSLAPEEVLRGAGVEESLIQVFIEENQSRNRALQLLDGAL